jgi:hypothetical protein
VSPMKYEMVFDIPEDGILHSLHRENLKRFINKKIVIFSTIYSQG